VSADAGRAEAVRAREAGWRQASGLGARAKPVLQLAHRAVEAAPGRIEPGHALARREDARIGDPAILVLLQANPLAARHFRDLGKWEDQELAVLAEDRQRVAGRGDGKAHLLTAGNRHDMLALARIGEHL